MIDINQFPHDSNLTINALLHVLKEEATDNKLTETLFIQMDNCGRENKNRYVFGFMAFLVSLGYVKEVLLSFLMVGHTHEGTILSIINYHYQFVYKTALYHEICCFADIDAKFSKISSSLKRNHAKTLPQLCEHIEKCTTDIMKTVLVKHIFNVRDWLKPSLSDMHNQSRPHVFRYYCQNF